MKKLIILIILIGAGYYGYTQFVQYAEEAKKEEQDNQDLSTALGQIAGTEPASTEAFDAITQEQIRELDNEWGVLVADGANPATSAAAPDLARRYSDILKRSYGKDSLSAFATTLVNEKLTPLAQALFFSRQRITNDPHEFFNTYTIASGDNLDNIGRTYGLSYQMINIMRGADAESGSYRDGEVLKIFNAKDPRYNEYFLHIDLSAFRMDFFIGGIFVRRYVIGHGKAGFETPTGKTFIELRERGETGVQWTNPETGKTYQAGEAENILGLVWMRFNNQIGRDGLGIHGYTGEGQVVNAKVSNGCIRMENKDALELYNMLVPVSRHDDGSPWPRVPMNVEIIP